MAANTNTANPGNPGGMSNFAGLNPDSFFGAGKKNPHSPAKRDNAFSTPTAHKSGGAGLFGLPEAFNNWDAAARYSFAPAMQFNQAAQPIADYFQGEMGRDLSSELYGLSADAVESQFRDTKRQQSDSLTRAGYGGGSAVSPLASMGLQNEAQARAGALGNAARQAVLQAQQYKAQQAQSLQNVLTQMLQAMQMPAQFQSARNAQVPIGTTGPSPIGPALNALGSGMNLAAGFLQ